jgi:hypothetical protein
MEIAVIGTREPGKLQRMLATGLTTILSQMGFGIRTGGAIGIDEIAMKNSQGNCTVILPWTGYNSELTALYKPKMIVYDEKTFPHWRESVFRLHPNPSKLSQEAVSLHAHNYGIVEPCKFILAFPSREGGGTMQGIRVARELKITPLIFKEHYGAGGADIFLDIVNNQVIKTLM